MQEIRLKLCMVTWLVEHTSVDTFEDGVHQSINVHEACVVKAARSLDSSRSIRCTKHFPKVENRCASCRDPAKHFRAVGDMLPRRAKVPATALHGDLPVRDLSIVAQPRRRSEGAINNHHENVINKWANGTRTSHVYK